MSSVSPARPPAAEPRLDYRRYRRLWAYFLRLTTHFLFWDVLLARPGLARFRKPPLARWRELAREYRLLAVEMGGLLIKIGQFLAARVDLLPAAITDELAELQDEVGPAPTALVLEQIAADLGAPIADLFAWVSPEPLGAASLAQVHEARLHDGEPVVIKALRPGIFTVIETDLAVLRGAVVYLKRFKNVRKQVDLDWLVRELTIVTRRELDMPAEGRNAERFAQDFANNQGIHVPRIHWQYSGARTLTMENVAYIRADDVAGLRAAGIATEEVAARLFDCYVDQLLLKHFVHADPHAGNLFVKPLPHPDEVGPDGTAPEPRPGEPVACLPGRPFQLVFVDFGMAVDIPPRLRAALRHYILGIATRDVRLIMDAYLEAGALLPGADLALLEELTARLLERFPGMFLAQGKNVDAQEYVSILMDYRGLLYSAPFQFQADLLYVFRALGIMSGMVARLDPTLDPVARVMPYVTRLILEEYTPSQEGLLRTVIGLAVLPRRLDHVLTRLQRGQLQVAAEFAPNAARRMERLERTVNRLTWLAVGGGMVFAGLWARQQARERAEARRKLGKRAENEWTNRGRQG